MKALVVDDSRVTRVMLGRILTELGCSFEQAANGQEGLSVLNEHGPFDLVLVDWNMPVMNGIDFVTAVRKDQRFAGVPIVMVTSEIEVDYMTRALSAGANEYIMKPFERESVESKLKLVSPTVGA